MKKQFFRVKQLADQTVGRAEKTEVLSEDLLGVEKRVDNIKHACNGMIKKISICLMGQGPDLEKRLKKIPETFLSSAMVEYSIVMGESTPMGSALRYCGEAMSYVGKDILQYELDIEKKVLQPLNAILENHIPVINKFKKQLNKQTLEMDISKTRYNEMLRRSYCTIADVHNNAGKIDALKEEYIDSCNKLDLIKDAYTTEMFKFLSKEGEISQILLNVIENQIEYHRNLMVTLDSIFVKAREYMSSSYVKPAFGCPLQEYLELTNALVSPIIEECVLILLEMGLDEVGLFRMTGSSSKIKKLRSALDSASPVDMQEFVQDSHVITGTLKLYLRELPEPLLTFKLYDEWLQAAKMGEDSPENKEEKRKAFSRILAKLPKPNYDNLNYLIQFLSMIVKHSDINLMNSSNLSIVIGPNLLWKHGDSGMDLSSTNVQNSVTEYLIENCDKLFPQKIDFKTFENIHQTSPNYKEYDGHFSSLPSKSNKRYSTQSATLVTKATSDENLNSISSSQRRPKDITQASSRICKSINEIREGDEGLKFDKDLTEHQQEPDRSAQMLPLNGNDIWKRSNAPPPPPPSSVHSLFPPHRYVASDEQGKGQDHLYTSVRHKNSPGLFCSTDSDGNPHSPHQKPVPRLSPTLSVGELCCSSLSDGCHPNENVARRPNVHHQDVALRHYFPEKFPPLPPLPPPEKLMLTKRRKDHQAPVQRQSLVTMREMEGAVASRGSARNILVPAPSSSATPFTKPKILGSKPKPNSSTNGHFMSLCSFDETGSRAREALVNLKLVQFPIRPPRKSATSLIKLDDRHEGNEDRGRMALLSSYNGHTQLGPEPNVCPLARIDDECGSEGDEMNNCWNYAKADNISHDKVGATTNGTSSFLKATIERGKGLTNLKNAHEIVSGTERSNGNSYDGIPLSNNPYLPFASAIKASPIFSVEALSGDSRPKPPNLPPPPKLKNEFKS